MADEIVTLDWDHEHARWEKEMTGLRLEGPEAGKAAAGVMGRHDHRHGDFQLAGVAVAPAPWPRTPGDRDLGHCRSGRPVVAQKCPLPADRRDGDRSHVDSIHNKRKGVKVRSNREEWQLTGAVGDGQDESDLTADWATWRELLGTHDRGFVEALETGDVESVETIKNAKRRKRDLADEFRVFRAG